jgi:hypothetical protein
MQSDVHHFLLEWFSQHNRFTSLRSIAPPLFPGQTPIPLGGLPMDAHRVPGVLHFGERVVSANGVAALMLTENGNVILNCLGSVTWAAFDEELARQQFQAGTPLCMPPTQLVLSGGGRLELRDNSSNVCWTQYFEENLDPFKHLYWLRVQDDCNMNIYYSAGPYGKNLHWSSRGSFGTCSF